MNSIGSLLRSQIGVRWLPVAVILRSNPASSSTSTIFFLACFTESPSRNPACEFIVPSIVIAITGSSRFSRKKRISVKSPYEHIITRPVPLSISAAGCALIGTSFLYRGDIAVFPSRCAYRSSLGLKITMPRPQSSSGRVVPMMSGSPVSLHVN